MTFSPQPEASGYFIAPRHRFASMLDEAVYYLLLARANYRDGSKTKRGQVIISQASIAEEFGLHRLKVKRVFDKLKDQGFITWERLPKGEGLLVTIVDYDRIQKLDFEHHLNISRTSSEHHGEHHSEHHGEPENPVVALNSGFDKANFEHHGEHHHEHGLNFKRTASEHTRTKGTKELKENNAAAVYKTAYTVEDPQEQQHQQQEANIFTTFERAYGRIPTPFQVEVFSSFIEDGLPEALVCRAIEKAAMDGKGPRYAQGILQDWLAKGIRTVEQAEREEREWRAQQQKVVPLNRQQQKQDLDWTPPYWREYVPKEEPKPKFDILKLDVDKLPLLNAKQRAHLKKLQEEERKRRAQAAMKDAANGSA